MIQTQENTDPSAPETRKPIPELSVVMPARDEEEALPQTLAEAVEILESLCELWELLVVDDGSTDGTAVILEEWSEREPRVRVLTQHGHLGYSAALRRGFDAARYLVVLATDADGQYDLREAEGFFGWLKGVDMVAGYRLQRHESWVRRFESRIYNALLGPALGVQVQDVNCSFKMFRSSFLQMMDLSSEGFLIDAELFARARPAGLRWIEIGVDQRPRAGGASKVRLGSGWAAVRDLWRLRKDL